MFFSLCNLFFLMAKVLPKWVETIRTRLRKKVRVNHTKTFLKRSEPAVHHCSHPAGLSHDIHCTRHALTFSEMSKQGPLLAIQTWNVDTKTKPVVATDNYWLVSSNILIIGQKCHIWKKLKGENKHSHNGANFTFSTMRSSMDWKWQFFDNLLYKPANQLSTG